MYSPYIYSAPPCVYKRRRRAPSPGIAHPSTQLAEHTRSLSSILALASIKLAETWELPSLSCLACTLGSVQDNTVHSHTLLDVRPRGRNQNKLLRYCVTSCINHLGLGTRSIITSWHLAARSGHRQERNPYCKNKPNIRLNY